MVSVYSKKGTLVVDIIKHSFLLNLFLYVSISVKIKFLFLFESAFLFPFFLAFSQDK